MKEIAVIQKKGFVFRLMLSILMVLFAVTVIVLFAMGQADNAFGFVVSAAVIFFLSAIFFFITSIKVLLLKNPVIIADEKEHLIFYPLNERKTTTISIIDILGIEIYLIANRLGRVGNLGSIDIITKDFIYAFKNIVDVAKVKETIEYLREQALELLVLK